MNRQNLTRLAVLALIVSSLPACASKKYVRSEVGLAQSSVDERVDAMSSQIEETQSTLAEHEQEMGEISKTAQEALDRAIAAGLLAEGSFVMETVLSNDQVRFGFDDATLSPEGEAALDELVAPVIAANSNSYIEIQGHTDSIGSSDYNLVLGERRAEAVRRYLNQSAGVQLHRMSVISYGETAPMVEESSPEARSANRRVTLVILR